MANSRSGSSKPPGSDEFLGGGVQFNKVGSSIPGSASPPPDEQPIVVPATGARTRAVRTMLIIAAIILLAAVLYVFSNDSLGGIQHTAQHGGVSPTAHSPAPPKNF